MTYQHGAEANAGLMQTLRESGYRALEVLRSGGEVAAIGIGVNEREVLLEAMEWAPCHGVRGHLSPVSHPAVSRVGWSFEPVRLGAATGRGA
jgi:hypothetical protein